MSGVVTSSRRTFLRRVGGGIIAPGFIPSIELVAPPEPRVTWRFDADGRARIEGVVDRTAYVSGSALHALDATNGSERWRVEADRHAEVAAVHGDSVYVRRDGDIERRLSATGAHKWTLPGGMAVTIHAETAFVIKQGVGGVHAVDVADGRELWTSDAYIRALLPPVFDSNTLFVGDGGSVHALDPETGATRWTTSIGEGWSLPVVDRRTLVRDSSSVRGDTVLAWNTKSGVLHGLSIADGSERWRVEHPTRSSAAPVTTADGTVFVAGEDALTAHDFDTGEERWRAQVRGFMPRVANDAVYVSAGGTIHAFDADTGARRWRHDTPSERPLNLGEIVGDTVPISSFDGWVAALDAADGSLRWRYAHGGEPAWFPVMANDTVYLGTRDGRALAFTDPVSPAPPLRRLTPTALVGGLGVAGALAVAGYRRFRGNLRAQ